MVIVLSFQGKEKTRPVYAIISENLVLMFPSLPSSLGILTLLMWLGSLIGGRVKVKWQRKCANIFKHQHQFCAKYCAHLFRDSFI